MCLSIAAVMFAGVNALAATFTVTTTADSGAGSLRAAIALANGSAGNSINFSGVSGTITLASTLPQITQSMTITGPGASTLAISGNNAYQILNISSATVTISGLTFANGNAHGGDAGAIFNDVGALTLTNSTFSGNDGNYGGAVTSYGALTVVNCTFSGNSAKNGGGAINTNVTLNVTNSTFSANLTTAPYNPNNGGYGGGAILDFGSAMTVTNSTFSGNSSAAWGGAIYASGRGTTLTANNIFIGNSISNPSGGAGIAAFVATSNASYNLFYQNVNATGTEDDCDGCTSNTNIVSANPNLLPLGYYGGPTETMLPLPGSLAICAGNYADVPSGVTTDQRGFSLMNSACSNGGVDVGAVQSDYVQVTNTNDSGAGSLRAAINAVNASSYGGDIEFAAGVTGTITLASALPTINQSLTIIGPGASNLTISGNNAYQIFEISSSSTVFISGLTLANGMTTGDGGAIFSSGTLTLTNSAFSGNSAVDLGGAIRNNAGMLMVVDSTFSGNYASSNGGAISSTGALTVTNSTFSGNTGGYEAAGGAGAIYSTGMLTVTDSTFSENSGNYGGAIYNFGSSVAANNNIFTNNSSQYGRGAGILDDKGTVNASHNLYFQNLDAGATEDDCNGCATNTNALTGSDPLLAALDSHGGPTQILLPQPGSSAICAGSVSLVPTGVTTDQRGFGRTTTYRGSTCVDLGAVQTDYTAVAFSNSSYSGIANRNLNPAPIVIVTENGQNIGGVSVTLGYSGTGSPAGLGPAITVAGTGATFKSLTATSAAQGMLSVNMPITAPGNSVQPAALTSSATLTIQLPTQTITFVTPSSLTYGNAPITLTATGGASGNPVTFSLDETSTLGAATLSGSRLTITGVGTIVVDANQAAGSGYSGAAQVQQSIVINKVPLTITASSPTVTYGSAVPAITPIFSTFFNGDTSAVLTKQPICTTAYTATSSVGSSPATSCSGALAGNYTFTYINGSVTVNPAPTFAIAGGNASMSISPGATTGNTVPITVTPSNGFIGTVSLTCSISPVAASNPPTCSLSPSSLIISGTGAQDSTLTISTTAAQVGESPIRKLLWPSAGTALALVMFVRLPRRRKSWLSMLSVLAFLIAIGVVGCGGGSGNGGNAGTTTGTYTVRITGSSGSTTGTAATITLRVQ
jgi:predicted outer membrane repeat protein